ncbi:MAG: response regulator, partial [Alphaproteobacteria bacterium]|nr:response regulator [Alphaproteobacteria bacterium]
MHKPEENQTKTIKHTHKSKNINILIAEDNEINAKLIKTILENKGVNIRHAWNGKEAFDIYTNSAIDLILMD